MSTMSLQPGIKSFTFVNQTGSSVVEKQDEEDLAIIKSHAMRAVHRQRRTLPRKSAQARPHPLAPLTNDWEQVALSQFFEDFVFPKETNSSNAFRYFDFLSGIYDRDAKQSHLTDAVLAVALTRFANQTKVDGLHLRAQRSYARSLSLVNQALARPVEMGSDEVLATLCLLTKYEIVSGDQKGFYKSHERGQAALINYRGEAQLQTEVGLALFRLIWIRQQLNCIAQSDPPPERPAFNWDAAFPSPHLKQLMLIVSRLVLVRHRTRQLLADTRKAVADEDRIAESQVAHEARSLDEDMLKFRQSLPPELQYWTILSCEFLPEAIQVREAGEYFPEHLHLFFGLYGASIWHVYRFCQIYLLQTLIQLNSSRRCHQHHARERFEEESSLPFTTTASPSTSYLHLRVRQAVDDACASAPFLLGMFDDPRFLSTAGRGRGVACHYSIWVLAATLSIPEVRVPEAQLEWIRDRLREIGFLHGIRHALVFA